MKYQRSAGTKNKPACIYVSTEKKIPPQFIEAVFALQLYLFSSLLALDPGRSKMNRLTIQRCGVPNTGEMSK